VEDDARAWAPGIVVDVVQLRPLVLVHAPDQQFASLGGAPEVGHGRVTLGEIGWVRRTEAWASNGGYLPPAPGREALKEVLAWSMAWQWRSAGLVLAGGSGLLGALHDYPLNVRQSVS
jgi:hypothetical protein